MVSGRHALSNEHPVTLLLPKENPLADNKGGGDIISSNKCGLFDGNSCNFLLFYSQLILRI